MPSARRAPLPRGASGPRRLAIFALCGAIGAGSLAGCETTQEKAAAQQAESARILKARAKRQARKSDGPKSRTSLADGTNSPTRQDKSAHRHVQHDKSARQGQKGEG